MRGAIVKFTSMNGNTLLAMHRAMTPLLTMNVHRNYILPDNQKIRKACHIAVQEVYITISIFFHSSNYFQLICRLIKKS